MMRLPNTVPIPAPEPATPTVAAPAPMNLAAVSMSLEMALVWKLRLGISEVVRRRGAAKLLWLSSVNASGRFSTTADSDRLNSGEVLLIKAGVETNLAQAYIFRGWGTVAGELELQKWHSKYCPCSSKDILISRKGALENLNGSESSNWPQYLAEMELEPWSQHFLHTASKISLHQVIFLGLNKKPLGPGFKICYPFPQPHELGLSNFPSIFCLRLPQSPTQKEPVSRLHCPGPK